MNADIVYLKIPQPFCRRGEGADIVTVLALADETTIGEVVKTAHENGRKVMADLITVSPTLPPVPSI